MTIEIKNEKIQELVNGLKSTKYNAYCEMFKVISLELYVAVMNEVEAN